MAQKPSGLTEYTSPKHQTPEGRGRLYVGNLPASTTEDQLYNYFRKFGALQQVCIPPSVRRKSKLFGFVQFANYADARRAITESQKIPFEDGRVLRTGFAAAEPARPACKPKKTQFKVVLTCIPKGTSLQEIATLASAFGTLRKLTPYKTCRGSTIGCRVKYASVESAYDLLRHGQLVLESGAIIQVKTYHSQSDKRASTFFSPLTQTAGQLNDLDTAQTSESRAILIRRFLVLETTPATSEVGVSRERISNSEPPKGRGSQPTVYSDTFRRLEAIGYGEESSSQHPNLRFNLRLRC